MQLRAQALSLCGTRTARAAISNAAAAPVQGDLTFERSGGTGAGEQPFRVKKKRFWSSKAGVQHFTNPDNHEHGGISDFVKSKVECTSAKPTRMYARSVRT